MARHAIGKLAHLHFASNEDAGRRLVKVVGAPQLDDLVAGEVASRDDLVKKYDLPEGREYLLVAQHPVTEEYHKAEEQIAATVEAVNRSDLLKVWIMPNNDAGAAQIKKGILKGRNADAMIFRNLPRRDFLGLLQNAACMVGNSSAGLIEAPSFSVPAVNIGRRQDHRVRGANVVDAPDFSPDAIEKAVAKALSRGFKASLQGMENPYGDGHSAARILKILETTPKDSNLLIKQLTY